MLRLLPLLLLTGCAGLGVTADATVHTARAYGDYVESFNRVNDAALVSGMSTPTLAGTEFGLSALNLFTLSRGRFEGGGEATFQNGTVQALSVVSRDLTFSTQLPVWATVGSDFSERAFAPVAVWVGVGATMRETDTVVTQTPAAGGGTAAGFNESEVMLRPVVGVTLRPVLRLPLVLRADAGYDLSVASSAQFGFTGFLAREYTAARGSSTGDDSEAITAGLPGLHARVGLTLELPGQF